MNIIPRSKDELTAEWLTAQLATASPAVEVRSLDADEITRGTTTRLKLVFRYNDEGQALHLPEHAFVKTSFDDIHRERLLTYRVFESEVRVYQALAPQLSVPVPRALVSVFDPTDGDLVLVLEDPGGSGRPNGDTPRSR